MVPYIKIPKKQGNVHAQLGCSRWIMSFKLNNKKGVALGSTAIKQVCRWQDNDYY
jgi:hypothetical protein